jgi:Carboxypeptidase activation peptide
MPGKVGMDIRMVVPPNLVAEFTEMTETFGIETKLITEDFQK